MIRIPSKSNIHLHSKDIVYIGMMVATLEAGKAVLSFLPNVEIVTLFIILYSLFFGARVFFAIAIFVVLEGLFYGFGLWWFFYLYVWPLLAILTLCFKKVRSVWFWSVFAGLFGLCFGFLSSLLTMVLSGPAAAFAYFVSGIPWDLIHGAGNFVITLCLFEPLSKVLNKAPFLNQSSSSR